jgi:hypothetical protein
VCFNGHHSATRWDEWVMWHARRLERCTGTQFQSIKLGESDHFPDLGVDGRVIFQVTHLELGSEQNRFS